MSENPMIRTRGLSKAFGPLKVLRELDLDIPAGQVVSIIGPSGSGKSTLLRLLMTLERPDAGTVAIDGEPFLAAGAGATPIPDSEVRRIRAKIGMVFQHFNLFPHMTALRNVMEAPLRVLKLSPADARQRAEETLVSVGLGDKLEAWPAQLSGGQKQRVAIARALAMRPQIMLFDEITSALDPELVGGILDLLRVLADAGDTTMLIVTHQMRFARQSSDRILFFDQGLVLEDTDPETMFTNPTHARTREFLDAVLGAE